MTTPPLVRVLRGEVLSPPPMWIMRQAGRYLPEYREVRATAPDFVAFCLNSELATEVTLQPFKRFAFDAAIVFADILLLPHAAGQSVRFVKGDGPVLNAVRTRADIDALDFSEAGTILAPVSETIRRVRAALDPDIAMIGFAGAPWTVATYMIGGGKDKDRWASRRFAWTHPSDLDELLARLADASADYLVAQAHAGADVLKLFDSWTDALPESLFERVSIAPVRRIVERVRAAGVEAPIIGFPKGSGALVARFAEETGVTAVALDMSQASARLVSLLPRDMPVQGGFDPALLSAGGPAMAEEVDRLLALTADRPYVFNLGHGVTPDTDPAHVAALVELVKGRT